MTAAPWAEIVLLVRAREVGRWTLTGPGRPDLAVVDALASLQLALRRLGGSVELHYVDPDLGELIDFVGLVDVLPAGGRPPLQGWRQTEGLEQVGVEEVVGPGDPVA